MASSILVMIKEEVTCPICLELMVEPVSADCDHSFCRACITLNYESCKSKEGEGICPVCRVSYPFGNLRSNRHLANIVEKLKGFKSTPEEEQKVNICAQHGEKLQLFCEKDMVAICWLCERSQEHRGHQTALVEEVACEYKGKLQAALQKQLENEKTCDEWQVDLQKERTYWENQIQSDVENVQMQFKGLRDMLDSMENDELQKLMGEKEDIMKRLEESENDLEEQRVSVTDLISDLEHQLQGSTMEMLQGVNNVLTRSYMLTLERPQMIPKEQRRTYRAPDLKGMLQMFQGFMDARHYWVHVTLHQVCNINVVIDEDKGQIHYPDGNRRNKKIEKIKGINGTFHLGVLGYAAIHSGKHYWEVDVSRCNAWLLGLNDGRCAQPQYHSVDESLSDLTVIKQVNYQPKHGYWVIGRNNRSVCNAFDECPLTKSPLVLVLSVIGPVSCVGVFLDREACTLSFYDVSNHGEIIYRFNVPSFPDTVYPYFNPMKCSEPMTICPPPS